MIIILEFFISVIIKNMFNSPLPPICLEVRISNPISVPSIDNQYTCSLIVKSQQIKGSSSEYTVSDVQTGFWISNHVGGEAWKIINLTNLNTQANTVNATIEDVEY